MMYVCKTQLLPSLLLLTATVVNGFVTTLLTDEIKLDKSKFQTLSSYCPPNPADPEENVVFVKQKPNDAVIHPTNIETIISKDKTRRLTEDERMSLKLFEFRHHGQAELEDIMKNVSSMCSDVARMYSIGKSFQGTDLLVMEFSMHPGTHKIREPEIRYVGTVHGNEVS